MYDPERQKEYNAKYYETHPIKDRPNGKGAAHTDWLTDKELDQSDQAVINYVKKTLNETPVKKKRTSAERIWTCSKYQIMVPHNYRYFEIYPKQKTRIKPMETFIEF